MSISIEQYTEKAIVVRGDTKEYKDKILELGGKWNTNLRGGGGWIFPNSKKKLLEELQESIRNGDVKPSSSSTSSSSSCSSSYQPQPSTYDSVDTKKFVSIKEYLALLSRVERLEVLLMNTKISGNGDRNTLDSEDKNASNKVNKSLKSEMCSSKSSIVFEDCDFVEEEEEEQKPIRLLRKKNIEGFKYWNSIIFIVWNIKMSLCRRRAITSYGVILFTTNKFGELQYQLCQRRDTISYAEFLKDRIPENLIRMHISLMSQNERDRCIEYFNKNDPCSLWRDLWINHNTRFFKNEMSKCCSSFISKMNTYFNDFLKEGRLENPWGFAKGRKNCYESEIDCALREFEEETTIPRKDIQIINYNPYEELYIGTDGKTYKTVYFLGYIPYIPEIKKKTTAEIRKSYISEEVSNIEWLNFKDCMSKLDFTKQSLLRKVHKYLIFNKRKVPKRRFTI